MGTGVSTENLEIHPKQKASCPQPAEGKAHGSAGLTGQYSIVRTERSSSVLPCPLKNMSVADTAVLRD